jgi:polyhydroxyalkanoate synthesis regulator phasin
MTNQLEILLQTMRDALEKMERAVQLPTRKDFETMSERVKELSKRIDQLEKSGPKKKKSPKKK